MTKIARKYLQGHREVRRPASSASLPAGFYELNGIDENLSYEDLSPIGGIAADTDVIGLGEGTHTSGGFYQAKFRLIKYLVETKGYRFIALETPWHQALKATAYVESCSGTSNDAVKSLYNIYQDKSFQNLLEWACTFNQSHPSSKVAFFGIDTKVLLMSDLTQFIESQNADSSGTIRAGLKKCAGSSFNSYSEFQASDEYKDITSGIRPITSADLNECLNSLEQLETIASADPGKNFIVQAAILSLKYSEKSLAAFDPNDPVLIAPQNARDEGMFKIFSLFRNYFSSNGKGVVMAHGAHVQMKSISIDNSTAELKFLGAWLKENLGNSYTALTVSGYHVETSLPENLGQYPEYADPDTLEATLHDMFQQKFAFVDFGSRYFVPGQSYKLRDGDIIPSEQFRGMIFLDYSSKMMPNFTELTRPISRN